MTDDSVTSESVQQSGIPSGIPLDSHLGVVYRRRAASIARRNIVAEMMRKRYAVAQKSQQELLDTQKEFYDIHHDIEEDEEEIERIQKECQADSQEVGTRSSSPSSLLSEATGGAANESEDSNSAVSAVSVISSSW